MLEHDKKKESPVVNNYRIIRFLKSTFIALIMAIPDFIYTTHIYTMSFTQVLTMIWRALQILIRITLML